MGKGAVITVKFSEAITQQEQGVLARFSSIIEKHWVEWFHLTASPSWERDNTVHHASYFRLMTGETKPNAVLSDNIFALEKMTPEEFYDKLVEARFHQSP